MYYYNMIGQRFDLPERPLEDPECFRPEQTEDEEDSQE